MSTLRCKFRATKKPPTPVASRAALMLALAHHVERLIEAGDIASYAGAARALGLTRARLTQVTNLLLLAPEIQERVLKGELRATERALRSVVREAEWNTQGRTADSCPSRVGTERKVPD